MARDQRWSCSAFVSGICPNRLRFTVSVMVANLDAPLCLIPPAALLVRHLVPPRNENHGSEIHCAALDGGRPRDGHGRHRAKLPNPGGHVACSFRSKLPLFVLVHSGFITD